MIKGVHIDAKTSVEDLEKTSDVLIAKVEGVVKGAVVIDEMKNHESLREIYEKGYYWVTMAVPLDDEGMEYLKEEYGKSSSSLLEVLRESGTLKSSPSAPSSVESRYDYVIVDTRGIGGVMFTMLGYKIYSKDGTLLYAPDPEKAAKVVPSISHILEKGKALSMKALRVEKDSIYVDADAKEVFKDIKARSEKGKIYIVGLKMKAEK